MTFQESIKTVFSKYFTLNGRADRSEFWWFWLFQSAISLAIFLIFGLYNQDYNGLRIVGWCLYGLFCLATFIPYICVEVRRLHDIGKGGGWIFISLVPVIGSIWLLVLLLTHGEPGENRFGSPQ